MSKVRSGEISGVLAAHTLGEIYAVLTRLPAQPRIQPGEAAEMITELASLFRIVAIPADEYLKVIAYLASHGISGGAVYDALILHAASLAGVDQILTFNARDFRRVYPSIADRVTIPGMDQ